jgi:phosphatidylethanolamine/phosphatidyl-N-methylethanolamine N-methyltransferase
MRNIIKEKTLAFRDDFKKSEHLLFFRQALKNPKTLGSFFPSSPNLAAFIARHVLHPHHGQYIIEIGAGTGRLTQALCEASLDKRRLILIEMDPDLCRYLKVKFPQLTVIHGCASRLEKILPSYVCGNVGVVVSGIPMMNLTLQEQKAIVESVRHIVMPVYGRMLQFTYGPLSPLSSKKLDIKAKRLGSVFLNIPPATVWQYGFD